MRRQDVAESLPGPLFFTEERQVMTRDACYVIVFQPGFVSADVLRRRLLERKDTLPLVFMPPNLMIVRSSADATDLLELARAAGGSKRPLGCLVAEVQIQNNFCAWMPREIWDSLRRELRRPMRTEDRAPDHLAETAWGPPT
jgi:hypothetical protein